jgi:large subunit ribosomal protein L4
MPSASAKAPLLDGKGKETKQVTLDGSIFCAEIKPHLVHETVRAELNAARAGTRGAKSRGQVSGGRSKPWRQKGTGRARIGTTRAPHWTGGGVAFPPVMRSFAFKVNRKEKRAAFRAALSAHVSDGTLALIDGSAFETPSTRAAAYLVATWVKELPLVVVLAEDEEIARKSFRNLAHTVVTTPEELEVAAIVWAKALFVSEQALPVVEARAGKSVTNDEPAEEKTAKPARARKAAPAKDEAEAPKEESA